MSYCKKVYLSVSGLTVYYEELIKLLGENPDIWCSRLKYYCISEGQVRGQNEKINKNSSEYFWLEYK